MNGYADTDDICQETALKCLTVTKAKGTPPPCAAYVVKMGLNARMDMARKFAPKGGNGTALDIEPSHDRGPVEEVLKKEEMTLLQTALASISANDRWIIERHVQESRTLESIAGELQRPPQTIRNRYRRAMARLKKNEEMPFAYSRLMALPHPARRAAPEPRAGL
jgi:RNA polymerase sigma factor (sigma-70 family)